MLLSKIKVLDELPRRSGWIPPSNRLGLDPKWPVSRLRAFSYCIGVLLKGDGFVSVTRKTDYTRGRRKLYRAYKLGLKNKSRAFIQKFNLACSILLRRKQVRVGNRNGEGHYQIQYCCKEFVLWWFKQGLSGLRGMIEAFPADYLRGRFDSDCNVHGTAVDLCGAESHRRLMEFERGLCIKLGMRTGPIHEYGRPGEINYTGLKKIVSKQQKIRFTVNARDFMKHVGMLSVEWRDYALRHAYKGRQWTPWPILIRERALFLRREYNWKYDRIISELGNEFGKTPPYTTVYTWLNSQRDL